MTGCASVDIRVRQPIRLNPQDKAAGLQDPILEEAEDSSGCPNAAWWREGHYQIYFREFIAQIRAPYQSSHLSPLDQLVRPVYAFFRESGVQNCRHPPCVEFAEKYLQALPACSWARLRTTIASWIGCWLRACYASFDPNVSHVGGNSFQCDLSPFVVDPTIFFLAQVHGKEEMSGEEKKTIIEIMAVLKWVNMWLASDGELQTRSYRMEPSWDTLFNLQKSEYMQRVSRAMQTPMRGICKATMWNIAVMREAEYDLMFFILDYVRQHHRRFARPRRQHLQCTEQICSHALEDATKVPQLHKCGAANCHLVDFPIQKLEKVFEHKAKGTQPGWNDWKPTAWDLSPWKIEASSSSVDTLITDPKHQPYIAISHVWSDGTGVGANKQGVVNSCLVDFWCQISRELGCNGLWWDVICLPTARDARTAALSMMLFNYSKAKHVVVHDEEIVNTVWDQDDDDGFAAIALVISTWFSRAWTTAEFLSANASIKVLFKNKNPRITRPEIVGLDSILARRPPWNARVSLPSLAHLSATTILKRLRPERHTMDRNEFGTLVQMLRAKWTSWERDRVVVATLLAARTDPHPVDMSKSVPELSRIIIESYGIFGIPRHIIITASAPQNTYGGWSWCPPTVFDLAASGNFLSQQDSLEGAIRITDEGHAELWFFASAVTPRDQRYIRPYSSHPAVAAKIYNALENSKKCLVLKANKENASDPTTHSVPAILVMPVRIVRRTAHIRHGAFGEDWKDWRGLSCRYIGCVYAPVLNHGENGMSNPPKVFSIIGDDVDENGIPLAEIDAHVALSQADRMNGLGWKDDHII